MRTLEQRHFVLRSRPGASDMADLARRLRALSEMGGGFSDTVDLTLSGPIMRIYETSMLELSRSGLSSCAREKRLC